MITRRCERPRPASRGCGLARAETVGTAFKLAHVISNKKRPNGLTALFGRADDLRRIRTALARSPLVTLTGVGGVGKPRLAQVSAGQLSRAFPGGVWVVALGDLAEGGLVSHAVARALDVYAAPDSEIEDLLCGRLRGKPSLLVLDNCEHLLEA